MSDQTPPTDAPSAGDYPPPTIPAESGTMPQASDAAPPVPPVAPPVPPVAPPVPPVAPPVPPYAAQPPTGAQYAGVQHPATPDQTVPYPQAQYPNPPYPQAQYPTPPYANPQYPGAPGPSTGYNPGPYSPANYSAGFSPSGAPAPKNPGGLGLVALLLSLVAAVVAPVVGAVAAFQVGAGSWSWSRYETMPSDAWPDLSFLSPVREWVLLGEIAFWAGTVLGIWAIVQGIVAIAKRRGLGTGIAAIVVAVLAVFIFGTIVYAAGLAGIATGASMGA